MYCEVYLFDAPYHIDRPFDYFCPDHVRPGCIVKVPFGRSNNLRAGIVTAVKLGTSEPEHIKEIHSVINYEFSLTEELMALCRFMKDYTLCTFGEAARTVLPPGALAEIPGMKLRRTCALAMPVDRIRSLLSATGRAGVRSPGQRRLLEYLLEVGTADMELVRAMPGYSASHVGGLVAKGAIRVIESRVIRNPYAEYAAVRDTSPIVLSPAQTKAYDTITELLVEDKPRAALLYGVTGSGKTKVIMKTIDLTIERGQSVIMLVPEISLTPQTVSIFCRRYGERVAVIHSSLSKGERLDAYRRIKEGEVDLVIGTRSAVFAPLSNLGMIVIDEEHEHTY